MQGGVQVLYGIRSFPGVVVPCLAQCLQFRLQDTGGKLAEVHCH